MEAIKKVCKAAGVICLVVAVGTGNVAFALATVVFAAAAIGIEIKNWRK